MSRYEAQIRHFFAETKEDPKLALEVAQNKFQENYFLDRVRTVMLLEQLKDSVWLKRYPQLQQFLDLLERKLSAHYSLVRFHYQWGQTLYQIAALDPSIASLVFQSLRLHPSHLPESRFVSEPNWLSGMLSPVPTPSEPMLIEADQALLTEVETENAQYESFVDFCPPEDNPFSLPDEKAQERALLDVRYQGELAAQRARYHIFRIVGPVDPIVWFRFLRDEADNDTLQRMWTFLKLKVLFEPETERRVRHIEDYFQQQIQSKVHRIRRIRTLRSRGICLQPFTPREAQSFLLQEFAAHLPFCRDMCRKHHVE